MSGYLLTSLAIRQTWIQLPNTASVGLTAIPYGQKSPQTIRLLVFASPFPETP